MENEELIKVSDLLKNGDIVKRFFVPAYQRGYKWTKTQVNQLLTDLLEFKNDLSKDNNEFYCLQPLVTKVVDPTKYPEYEGYIEVIDGQQRLTTILLILQAIHTLIKRKDEDENDFITLYPRRYEIKYETRLSSSEWLNELKDIQSIEEEKAQRLINSNSDYAHLVEVYTEAYTTLNSFNYDELKNLRDFIYEKVRFIPYQPNLSNASNNDIFNDINAGKIELNNAELVKALLLQDSNLKDHESEEHRINTIALEWDAVEKTLQDKEFWGFIYSGTHPYSYDTHIEYLLDLIYEKKAEDRDYTYFTFDKVNEKYKKESDKLKFAETTWGEIKQLFDTLVEWYNSRKLYHRIGYLLEYGKDNTVLSLKEALSNKKKDEQIAELDNRIKTSLKDISSEKLFYKESGLSQVLFLYNALAEDQRVGSTARFSFADYRNIKKEKGWDQEHIASNTDAKLQKGDVKTFARDMIEYFTGVIISKNDELSLHEDQLNKLNDKERLLLKKLIEIANKDDYEDEELNNIFNEVLSFFDTNKDGFDENAKLKNSHYKKSEKNFIWNFALLNASTNRSYGNSLFPIKRKRILNDEFDVYTPVGTRNVFEKAYSRKLTNMLAWTRDDAKAYWEELCKVLSPYIKLEFPFLNY